MWSLSSQFNLENILVGFNNLFFETVSQLLKQSRILLQPMPIYESFKNIIHAIKTLLYLRVITGQDSLGDIDKALVFQTASFYTDANNWVNVFSQTVLLPLLSYGWILPPCESLTLVGLPLRNPSLLLLMSEEIIQRVTEIFHVLLHWLGYIRHWSQTTFYVPCWWGRNRFYSSISGATPLGLLDSLDYSGHAFNQGLTERRWHHIPHLLNSFPKLDHAFCCFRIPV